MLKPGDKVMASYGGQFEVIQQVWGTARQYVMKDEGGQYRIRTESKSLLVSSAEGQQALEILGKIKELDAQVGELYKQLEALFPQPKHRKPKEAPTTT